MIEATGYAAYGERTNSGFQTQKSYIGERFDTETRAALPQRPLYGPQARPLHLDVWDPTRPGVGTNRDANAGNDPVKLFELYRWNIQQSFQFVRAGAEPVQVTTGRHAAALEMARKLIEGEIKRERSTRPTQS